MGSKDSQIGRQQDRFHKFTEGARKVLALAQEEAKRSNHNYIGTEHFLLGLLRENEGVAAKVLSNLGVDVHKVRSAVEFIISRGDQVVPGEIGLTPRSKKVIELAIDEARNMNHNYIGTEHLLLGLVREGEGIAADVLESLNVSLEKVRTETVQVLGQSAIAQKIEIPVQPLQDAMMALESVVREKEQAIQQQQYKLAAELRDREMRLRDRISELERE